MPLTDIEAIRLKASDQPVRRQENLQGDGETTTFQLQVFPIFATPAIKVWVNDTLQVLTTDYTVDTDQGTVTFTTAPDVSDALRIEYTATVFSDDQVEFFLGEGGNSTTLGAVHLLLALAASAALIAKRETLAGGAPGYGSVTLDTAVRARELRETAKAYYTQYENEEGDSVPYEVLTQFAWTPFQGRELVEQELLRRMGY